MKINFIPAIVAIIILVLSLGSWPYGFYSLVKIVVTGIAIYYAYTVYESAQGTNWWFWLFTAIAILFNPIFPIYLYDKNIWNMMDIVVGILFLIFIVTEGRKRRNGEF